VLPYLRPLVDHPRSWAIHTTALLTRSRIESSAGRTVERALAQVESVVEHLRTVGYSARRLELVHSSHLPPSWEVERQLGKQLLGLGQVKTALDIYLRLEQWEEVIACYTHLQLRHKAEEVIRARLEEKETARLWCLLGDATDDLSCYHRALELSQGRSARAHRSLGAHFYHHKDWRAAIPWLQKSIERSSFQPQTLLRLSYSAMEVEDWQLAAKTYRAYCALEQDSFEAWNNLARCYVHLEQKERAWRVLQEAVRCDFDNWKVWDNMMVIATDIGQFEDVIRSYNRVLDIKKTHVDQEVLGILVRAVVGDVEDFGGQGSARLRPALLKLLGRLTVAGPREHAPWRLYGDLLVRGGGEERARAAQAYQRSLAALTGHRGWEKVRARCEEALATGLAWVELVLELEGAQQLAMANSARLSVGGAVKMVEKGQEEVTTGRLAEEVELLVAPVRAAMENLLATIARLKN